MSDLEKQIKSNNRRTMLRNAFQNLFDSVSKPFVEFKEYLDEKHEKKELEKQYQNECYDVYKKYLKFAENKGKHGVVETLTDENGKTTTIVYTDHGPLIKTQTQFERFGPYTPFHTRMGQVFSTYQGFFKDDKGKYEFRDLHVTEMTGWKNYENYYMHPVTEVRGFSLDLRNGEATSKDITLTTEQDMGCDKFLSKNNVCIRYLMG